MINNKREEIKESGTCATPNGKGNEQKRKKEKEEGAGW